MSYSYPTTKEEYWSIVDQYWENIFDILNMFLSKEKAVEANNMRLNKDTNIVRLFNSAWSNAPDDCSIHSIPSWHVLCDLCSESYVLDD